MFCEKLLCAGFGGQGVMSLGQLLAYAGMVEGKQVTWLPSYGPEMRGGTAYCCVMVSDYPVGSPLITNDASCAIVMNLPSFLKFEPRVAENGLLLVNSSIVTRKTQRKDLDAYYLPANEEAVKCGNEKSANMIMLGAYLELTGVVSPVSVEDAFRRVFKKRNSKVLEQNRAALARGAELVQAQTHLPAAV